MKLGDGGEAFFIFQTESEVPQELQTSPIASPSDSPVHFPPPGGTGLQEPDYFDLNNPNSLKNKFLSNATQLSRPVSRAESVPAEGGASGDLASESRHASLPQAWSYQKLNPPKNQVSDAASESRLDVRTRRYTHSGKAWSPERPSSSLSSGDDDDDDDDSSQRYRNLIPTRTSRALERVSELEQELSMPIQTNICHNGDVMLDTHGYKQSHADSVRLESLARKILVNEAGDNVDGLERLIREDQQGNLWIHASDQAKLEHAKWDSQYLNANIDGPVKSQNIARPSSLPSSPLHIASGLDDSSIASQRALGQKGALTTKLDPNLNYAKTLRLTNAQLKSLDLVSGINPMSFSVTSSYYGQATVIANIYFWKHNVPIVISDIDGTITKCVFYSLATSNTSRSDALGHVLTMIGRDWTHDGVAKLYTDIRNNGYHILYLTSRSVGQADSTRDYLKKIVQNNFRLPEGPVIMSPDRTMAALRREMVLRKPEVFKMACLRDLQTLFGKPDPFYAGFGNRITDALSYRSVGVPSSRIFTINSTAEVKMELLEFAGYKSSYIHMTDLVDHFFPPIRFVQTEAYSDVLYWKIDLPELSEDETKSGNDDEDEEYEEEEEEDDDDDDDDDEAEDDDVIEPSGERIPQEESGGGFDDELADLAEELRI